MSTTTCGSRAPFPSLPPPGQAPQQPRCEREPGHEHSPHLALGRTWHGTVAESLPPLGTIYVDPVDHTVYTIERFEQPFSILMADTTTDVDMVPYIPVYSRSSVRGHSGSVTELPPTARLIWSPDA